MQRPDTLVVTATLGTRPTLDRTIDSVKKIGGDRVRHVIVAPAKACPALREKYSHLTVIEEPQNCKGIYSALNFGLKSFANDHKYLTYINDDDFWCPGFKELFHAMDHSNLDIAYGRVNFVDSSGQLIKEQASSPHHKQFGNLLSKGIVLFTQQATLSRSKLFIKLGGFDENYKLVSDTKFWLEALRSNANFKYVNNICANYTIQEGQLSSNKSLQMMEHESLLQSIQPHSKLKPIFSVIAFRAWNFKVYLKRIINTKKQQIIS